jgi:hypothetical protein
MSTSGRSHINLLICIILTTTWALAASEESAASDA